MTTIRTVLAAVVAVLLVLAVAAGVWWWLDRDRATTTAGTCGDLRYELEAETDDGQVEVSFELTTSRPGEAWVVVLREGDTVLTEGERLSDEDAELDLHARVPEDGRHTYTAEATAEDGGNACVAKVTHG